MNNAPVLEFEHQLFYSNKRAIPAVDIAESLLALDRIVGNSPRVFKKLVPGVRIQGVQLFVTSLEEGSLYEDIFVKFIFGSQEELDKFIAKVRQKTGIDVSTNKQIFATVLIAMVVFGAGYATRLFTTSPQAKATIEANENVIIQIGAGELKMTPEQFVAVLDSAISRKPGFAKDAVKVIGPAKHDPQAKITIDGREDIAIKPETVQAIPHDLQPTPQEKAVPFAAVEIHLRANDLDNAERGWAAMIPTISPRRLTILLPPGINPDDLYGKKTITADVNAIYTPNAHGNLVLRRYEMLTIVRGN